MSIAAIASCLVLSASQASTPWRQYASPHEAGFSAEELEAARAFAEQIGSAAVFVVYRGDALVAWGEVERRYECRSVRKSLMNALLGIAIDKKHLDIDASLAELAIDDVEPLTDAEKRARVRDLLGARSGVYHPAAKSPQDMRAERPARGSHAAGEHFFYNNWDFNTLGTIFERASKTTVAEAFDGWIARPLGMEDYRTIDVWPELEPSYSMHPAHAFRMSARDLARFGELYRRRGEWNGRRILSEAWVRESTTAHSVLGERSGYGFLWWTYGKGALDGRPMLAQHDMYCARGTGGQFILVVPDAELVLVHRGDVDNEREVRGPGIWELAERVLAARVGPPAEKPALRELRIERFGERLPARPDHRPVRVSAAVFDKLVGDYEFPQGMVVRAFVHDGRLFVHRNDGEESELLPLSETRYFLFANAYEVEFVLGDGGRAVGAKLVTPGGALAGRRTDE